VAALGNPARLQRRLGIRQWSLLRPSRWREYTECVAQAGVASFLVEKPGRAAGGHKALR
jgi:hypothetical protein